MRLSLVVHVSLYPHACAAHAPVSSLRRGGVTLPGGRAAVLGETPFAVVDLETTGVYPGGHDRVIEIAVVRLRPDLQLEDEWATLVNPSRDIGRTDVHGIRAGDVADAPRFEEIAGDAALRLRDALLVGHHLRFDLGFLTSEFSRAAATLPALPGLCTLDLAYRLLPDAPSRKLAVCCEEVGVLHDDEHTALGDARATAGLLSALIERGRRAGVATWPRSVVIQPNCPPHGLRGWRPPASGCASLAVLHAVGTVTPAVTQCLTKIDEFVGSLPEPTKQDAARDYLSVRRSVWRPTETRLSL